MSIDSIAHLQRHSGILALSTVALSASKQASKQSIHEPTAQPLASLTGIPLSRVETRRVYHIYSMIYSQGDQCEGDRL